MAQRSLRLLLCWPSSVSGPLTPPRSCIFISHGLWVLWPVKPRGGHPGQAPRSLPAPVCSECTRCAIHTAWKKQPTLVKLGFGVSSTCLSAAPWREGPQRTSLPPEHLLGLFFPSVTPGHGLASCWSPFTHGDSTWVEHGCLGCSWLCVPPGLCLAYRGCLQWTQHGWEAECKPCLCSAASLTVPALGAPCF